MSQTTRLGTESDADTGSLPKSEYDWLFTEPRRRMALNVLEESSMPVDVEDLAAAIAREESGGDDVDEATTADVALTLHHIHLPKMDRLGVIDYDPASNRVVKNH